MYLVEISPFCSHGADVFVASIPDLLALLVVLQPLIALESIEVATEQLQIARKRFRAEHGHDVGECCMQCDPAEVQRRREHRQKQAMEKVRKGAAAK
jgi:hypothetical protein